MSEFAGNLPRKFISFRHLGYESSAHVLFEERESTNPQNVAEVAGVDTAVIGETSNSPAKVMSVLLNVPVSIEVVTSGVVQQDRDLTVAEKDCVITSSEEDGDDLYAFVDEKLRLMAEKGLEQFVGDENVNVEEILGGNAAAVSSHIVEYEGIVGAGSDQGKTTSVCPVLPPSGVVEASSGGVPSQGCDAVDRMLREELIGSRATSTPVKGLWSICSKRRKSVLAEREEPPCKSIKFGVTDTLEAVEGWDLSRSGMTGMSGGMEGSDFTSGGFSTLEAIAKKRADDRDRGVFELSSGDGMVRMPPAESIAEQEKVDRVKYYPSQSAKSLLKDFFELNPPTHLDPGHPTTSFSADQMIQFARAVGLEVSLASYGMLEDLLLKARIGGVGPAVGSRHSVGRSPFPSVAGSSWGESVGSRTNYSLPTVTEVDACNVAVTGVSSL